MAGGADAAASHISLAHLFDPMSDDFLNDPYSRYERLRGAGSLHFHPRLNGWLISHYADVDKALRDGSFGKSEQKRFFGNFRPESAVDLASRAWLLGLNPPDHTRIRRHFSRAFTWAKTESLLPKVERAVDALLDELATAGGGDFIATVAQPLPVTLICAMLGVPEEDLAVCREHSSALLPLLDPVISEALLNRAEEACAWFLDYFDRLVRARRREPCGDLLSALVLHDGEGALTHDELVSNIILLFSAGHETTSSMLGNGMHALLTHPEQYAVLRADLSLAGNAVLEVLRWDAPIQYFGRRAEQDVCLDGTTIERGQMIMGLIGAANRDPQRFIDPDRFDIRRLNCQPLSFGGGIHYCLGAALSRLEGEVAFRRIAQRFKSIELVTDPLRAKHFAVRSLAELKVAV